jgi:hypothetical protein
MIKENLSDNASVPSQVAEHAELDSHDRDDLIIAHLVEKLTPAADVARLLNAPLLSLARWLSEADNWHLLLALARANELQAAVVISRYRTAAASNLFHMASGRESTELARRACVDLLNAQPDVLAAKQESRGNSATPAQTANSNPFTAPVPNEQVILRALAQLAHENDIDPLDPSVQAMPKPG